jgi:MoaA/NifB/PqqE/SkfB family radical SAM enzyme
MPFCYSPWTNVDISPAGDITPCCKFRRKYYAEQFNIQTHTLKEYANSQLVDEIKNEFLNKEWPKGCERCRIEEENGIESKRQLDNARWHKEYQQYNLKQARFITASIAFGNTCNLKCITCGPVASSRWNQEYKDLYGIDIPPFKFYKKNFVQDFINQAPDIVHLDIPGGEPFLSGIDEQQELLRHYVDTGKSNSISLHYTTNGQIFPDIAWWTLWQHFAEVDIQLSIDGVADKYEYIRYPGNWNLLESNVTEYIKQEQELSNIRLSVSHTVSAYNIFYLDEFFEWCYNKGLPRPWLGRVHDPEYMRPGVWPKQAKENLINILSNSKDEDVRNWATLIGNTDDSIFFEKFKEQTKQHDEYRRTDFNKTFSELVKYL